MDLAMSVVKIGSGVLELHHFKFSMADTLSKVPFTDCYKQLRLLQL